MKAFLCFFLLLLVTIPAKSQIFQKTIHFENDEFIIDENDQLIIATIIDFINDETKIISSIEIYGFADSNASVNYNIELSKKRANAVSQIILPQLSSELNNKTIVSWHGELKPESIVKNLNYSSRSVDVIIHYIQKQVSKENISQLFEQLSTPVQKFRIDPKRDTILAARNGTLIAIKANSFYIPKSCEGELVDIILQESYDAVSILRNNLTTTTNGHQLESDGMIFVNAQLCNRILTLKEGSQFTFFLPTNQIKEGMELYAGSKDNSGTISWKVSNNQLIPFYYSALDDLLYRYDFLEKRKSENCPLFFCGLGRIFTGGEVPRKYRDQYYFTTAGYKKYIDSLCAVYNVSDYRALCEVLKNEKNKAFEKALEEGTAHVGEWNYYVTSVGNLGWMNCDRFYDLPEEQKTNVVVAVTPAPNVTANLVFTSMKSMMGANYLNDNLAFQNVAKGEKCFVVAMKFEAGKSYLSVQPITITADLIVEPEFKEYSVEEMKKELEKLGV